MSAKAKVDFSLLAERYVRALEAGKAGYKKADQTMDELIAAGAAVDQPIPLKGGRCLIIKDQFASKNKVSSGLSVRRYVAEVETARDITSKL